MIHDHGGPSRPHLRGHVPESLAALWPDLGLDLDHCRRIVGRVVGHDRDDLEGVRGLSKAKTAALRERASTERLELVDRRQSPVDGFVKYLFRSSLGGTFETVRIPLEAPRYSVCVSSQVGCALACAFCETGRLGLSRQLEPWEIVEQVLAVRRDSPDRPVTGVVFQGQGEPFHNYDNVLRAADVLRHPCGGRIGSDRMTISTVGLLPLLERYTEEGWPYRLILSLTTAFQDKRERLVPMAKAYPVEDLAAALRRHAVARRVPVHLGWVLMAGVNTQPEEAREIRRLFPDVPVRVSVIDVNPTATEGHAESRFGRADEVERRAFLGALAEQRIAFVRRYSGGPDILAACGMLASSRASVAG